MTLTDTFSYSNRVGIKNSINDVRQDLKQQREIYNKNSPHVAAVLNMVKSEKIEMSCTFLWKSKEENSRIFSFVKHLKRPPKLYLKTRATVGSVRRTWSRLSPVVTVKKNKHRPILIRVNILHRPLTRRNLLNELLLPS